MNAFAANNEYSTHGNDQLQQINDFLHTPNSPLNDENANNEYSAHRQLINLPSTQSYNNLSAMIDKNNTIKIPNGCETVQDCVKQYKLLLHYKDHADITDANFGLRLSFNIVDMLSKLLAETPNHAYVKECKEMVIKLAMTMKNVIQPNAIENAEVIEVSIYCFFYCLNSVDDSVFSLSRYINCNFVNRVHIHVCNV